MCLSLAVPRRPAAERGFIVHRSPLSLLSGVYVTRSRDASEEMKQAEMSEMELEAAFPPQGLL